MEYLKLFDTHSEYENYMNGGGVALPNVSHCVAENEVHYNPLIDPYNGHVYVNLGLPSGTLWAKKNVGANSETDNGLYFAWGETVGYADASTKAFSWSDYKYGAYDSSDSTNYGMTKYNNTDGISNLEPTDDAASVNMGGDWHMPTQQQCRELFEQTKNGFVTSAGTFTLYAWVSGDNHSDPTQTTATINNWNTAGYFFFKSNVTNYNTAISSGEYLFIPAAGDCGDGSVGGVGEYGDVWASSLSVNVTSARSFDFGSGGAGLNDYDSRIIGLSVRGVVEQIGEPAEK